MARKKTLDRYPPEFYSIFKMGNERELVIACDSAKAAHNLRNDLYSFRSVLEKYGTEEAVQTAKNVRLSVTENKLTVEPIRGPSHETTSAPE